MKMNKLVLLAGLSIAASSVTAYEVVDRFTLLEDKFKTEEMLRPYGHDFIIPDVSIYANTNLLDLADDLSAVSKGTAAEQLVKSSDLLKKYDKTEQTIRANIALGIPLPTFHAWGAKVVPDLRVNGSLGTNIGIRNEQVSLSLLFSMLDLPADIQATVEANVSDADIINLISGQSNLENLDGFLENAAGVDPAVAADFAGQPTPLWNVDPGATTLPLVPALSFYTKLDVRAKLKFDISKDNYFGSFGTSLLMRLDFRQALDSRALTGNDGLFNNGTGDNSQSFIAADLKFGKNFDEATRAYIAIEDIKVARVSDKIATGGDLNYTLDPLIRIHGDMKLEWKGFKLSPFAGVHKRKAYGFVDGLYAGTNLGFHFWGDRIGVKLLAMVDREHFTFSPQFKLWIMQIQYSLKQPISSTVDDVKVSGIHSLNLRIFF